MNIPRKPHATLLRITCYPLILLMITFANIPLAYATESTPASTDGTTTTAEQPSTTETAPSSTSTTPSTTVEPAPVDGTIATTPTPGPQEPTGADATSYTYNEATGLWESDKYTWDPATHQTAPKTTPTYSYNPETGRWDTTEWVWDAPSGAYIPNIISTFTPPADAALNAGEGPTSMATSDTPSTANGAKRSLSDNSNQGSPLDTAALTTTNDPHGGQSSGIFDRFYNAFISNKLSSSALTGDAIVDMNTLAGDALSGDATAIATIFNLLQSAWNLGITGPTFTAFTQNLFGDVVGDLWLEPPSTESTETLSLPDNVVINSSDDAAIHNTIDLEAISGDAEVTSNTTAGSATTGSATVIANIINAINSSIASGNSFVGMLNIHGSLNGDILMPANLIEDLLASNALGTLSTSQINNADVLGEFTNNLSTTNNVTTSATSGNATVDSNTTAGDATSGNATTNVTVLNLTGREVVGKNALLVFVNVLGSWVGMIVDAPTGTTSAAFGSGITEDNSLQIDQNNNQAITNDINAHATSGNALVANNTTAGNATSGDAMTAVNILNINNSQFALSDWFGVLFINVFGTWTGSFGMDTIAGTVSSPAPVVTPITTSPSPSTLGITTDDIKAFAFVPNSSNGTYSLEASEDGLAALTEAQVLKDTSSSSPVDSSPTREEQSSSILTTNASPTGDLTLSIIGMTLGLSLLGAERALNRRNLRIK